MGLLLDCPEGFAVRGKAPARAPADTPGLASLDRARCALGLTVTQVAEKLGCSQAAVSRYLSGSRTPPPALLELLGVTRGSTVTA